MKKRKKNLPLIFDRQRKDKMTRTKKNWRKEAETLFRSRLNSSVMYSHAGRQMKDAAQSSAQGQETENESSAVFLTLEVNLLL